jgi:hypothetical protein
MSTLAGPGPSAALLATIRHVLRPLVRLMLAGGVTFQIVSEILKEVFVDVAERDFRLDAGRPTDSRISLLTGVHRKDVRRLRSMEPSGNRGVPGAMPFSARLIAAWLGDRRFVDAQGQPRTLARIRDDAGEASFEDLVASHSKDCRPRVVLDEWLRLGIVEIDAQDRVRLIQDAFVPADGLDEKLHYFAHHLHDHAATATANLLGERAPQFERSVMYEGMSEASISKLERRARQLGASVLKDLNRLAAELDAADRDDAAPKLRFTFGAYFHSAPVETGNRSDHRDEISLDEERRGRASVLAAEVGAAPIDPVR